MTRKEFESLRAEIQHQKFSAIDCSPLQYATKRAEFRIHQLQRLIEIGRTIKDSKTVQRKVERWERQVRRFQTVPARMASLASSTTRTRLS